MTDIVKRLLDPDDMDEYHDVRREAADEIERLTAREEQRAERLRLYMNRIGELEADNTRLRAALQKLEWKSIDKDNMEYSCRVPYNVMDEIRRALEPKP